VEEGEVFWEPGGSDAEGGEEGFSAHLAEGEFDHEGGEGEDGGAVKDLAQGAHEFVLADGGGADGVDGAANLRG